MRKKGLLCVLLAASLCFVAAGCETQKIEEPEKVTLPVKTPPIGLGNIPGTGEAEVYDMLVKAAERFQAQYDRYDVDFLISRYDYLDEQTPVSYTHLALNKIEKLYPSSSTVIGLFN